MGVKYDAVEISYSDCHKTISSKLKTEDFKILNFQQIGFAELNGFLGEHCLLKIKIERDSSEETHTCFVKGIPRVQSQLNFLEEINGVLKEKNFFTKYHPLLKQHGIDILDGSIPSCYHLTEDGSLIFEDLKARGYQTLTPRTSLDVNFVKAGLVALSKLHASGLILEEMRSYDLRVDFGVELGESFYLGTGSTERAMVSGKHGIRALIDLTHHKEMKLDKDLFIKRALEGCDLQKVFTTPSTKFRNTICHADPWTKNFLFKDEGEINCVVVDFQTYRYGPPAQDVLAFIYLVTDKEVRDGHMHELLRFYWEQLNFNIEKFGFKDIVTKEEFFQSCVYFKQFALTQTLTHFPIVTLSDEIAKELFGDPEKAKYVVFENRYDFVKTVCLRDPVFKQRNFDALRDLRKFYEDSIIS